MEHLDLYDKDKNLIGKTIIRGEDVPKDNYINVVIIFMQNNDGKFLLQLTSKEKGHKIATTGGHVKAGETSNEAIISEVKEELGLDISKENFKFLGTFIYRVVLFDVYYLNKDIDINTLILQEEEVESVAWYSIDEMLELVDKGILRNSNIEGFKMVLNYIENTRK